MNIFYQSRKSGNVVLNSNGLSLYFLMLIWIRIFYMKTTALAASLLIATFSFGAFAADQVSKDEIKHFKLVKVGDISVSQTGGTVSSPSDLREKLSQLADEKGGKYYHIISAREHGPNFEAVATVYKDAK
jgi:hypothetical protein